MIRPKQSCIIALILVFMICIGCSATLVYRVLTQYNDEEDFFNNNHDKFQRVVEIVEQDDTLPKGCSNELVLPLDLQEWIGQEKIYVCILPNGNIEYIELINSFGDKAFAYLPNHEEAPDAIRIDRYVATCDNFTKDSNHWFLCSLYYN